MSFQYLEPKPGNFVSIEDGTVKGTHKGMFGLYSIMRFMCVVLLLSCFCVDSSRLVRADIGPEGKDRRTEGCLVCGGQRHHHRKCVCGTPEGLI